MSDTRPPDPDATLIDIDREIAAVQMVVDRAQESADEQDKKAKTLDRSMIARWIVCGFVVMVGFTFLLAIIGVIVEYAGVRPSGQNGWQAAAELAKEILSTVMLPVVTLVIGFYFGSEKK